MIPEDIYAGTEMAILEMLASGTTSFSTMYDFPFASAKAVAEMKAKASICRVGWCFDPNLDMKDCLRLTECFDFINILKGKKECNDELVNELKTNFCFQTFLPAVHCHIMILLYHEVLSFAISFT